MSFAHEKYGKREEKTNKQTALNIVNRNEMPYNNDQKFTLEMHI